MNFLRLSFFILLLANLLFFTWSHGYLGVTEEGREPQRLTSQLSPEKLHILSSDTTKAAMPATTNDATAANTTLPTTPLICRLVSNLTHDEAQQLQTKLSEKLPALQVQLKPVDIPPGYWAFIPPQPNQSAAEKKMAELKKLNIPNFADFQLILEEGSDKFSISLGMFDEALAANTYLKSLAKYGIRTAKVQLRSRPAEKSLIEVHGPAATMQHLAELTTHNLEECPLTEPAVISGSATPNNSKLPADNSPATSAVKAPR